MRDHQTKEDKNIEATDRNVYILGAGFSSNAGAPLIHGFLDYSRRLHDQPFSDLDKTERQHFKNAFEFRRKMAQAREKVLIDLDDIEQLFGLVEISQRLSSESPETRDSIVYLIAKTLQLSIDSQNDQRPRFRLPVRKEAIEFVPNFLKHDTNAGPHGVEIQNIEQYTYFMALGCGLFDDPDRRRFRKDSIITFNYDLVCDHALRKLGFEADYHLPGGIVGDQRELTNSQPYDLLKLHGSTNWGICNACKEQVVVLSQKVTDSPSEFRELACKCGKKNFVPFLVPPSWDKSEFRQIIAPVWKKAADELKQATRICIIGYSMPESDAFFKYLLTVALAENHQLYKLIVVDFVDKTYRQGSFPDSKTTVDSSLRSRYERLLDPVFQQRRFSFFDDGLYRFLVGNHSRIELERGELLVNTSLG